MKTFRGKTKRRVLSGIFVNPVITNTIANTFTKTKTETEIMLMTSFPKVVVSVENQILGVWMPTT